MKSIRNHLQISLALSSLFLIVSLWIVNNYALRTLFSQIVISRLDHDVDALLQLIDLSDPDMSTLTDQLPPIYKQPHSGHYFAIQISPAKTLYSPSLWEQVLDFPQVAPGSSKDFKTMGPNQTFLRGLAKSYVVDGNEITIAVTEDLTIIHEQRVKYKSMLAAISVLGFAFLLAVQLAIIRHIIRNMSSVQREVEEIHEGSRSALSAEAPEEIQPLVTTFNQLLRLLQDRVERSRRAVGNLAHALNTPLSYLIQYFDLPGDKRDAERTLTAREQSKQIEFLIQRGLKHASLSGHAINSRKFDPEEDLQELIDLLKLSYREKILQFQLGVAEETSPFGDREDMLELIGNLLDNACKWARSRVRVHVSGSNPVSIQIEDDGPGVPEKILSELGKRGLRLDENVQGHGLGISISKEIVGIYGGDIFFGRSELGGLSVRITL